MSVRSAGTVTIDTPALSGGAVVSLASSHPGVTVPSTVTVAAGETTVAFVLTVAELNEDISTTVTANLFNTHSAMMAVYLPGVEVSSVTVSPRSVVGGVMTGQGTVTLTAPARSGGTVATLTSSNSAAAAVATSLNVPEGTSAANFSIATGPTSGPTPVTITATYGTTRSAELTVSPCTSWVADADGFSSTETVWLDDMNPSYQYFDTWLWDSNQKVSGTQSNTVVPAMGHRAWRFNMPNVYLGIPDLLTQYVLIDPCNPPRGFMVRWRENDSYGAWTHGAYWGEKPFDCGIESPACRNMGPVPPAGKWTRLEVPARKVGLNNTPVWGMAFNILDGRLWLDRSGKDACVMPNAPPRPVPSTEVVWVEDALPAGATAYGTWNWDAGKKVSGTQSHTEPAKNGFYQHYFAGASQGLTIGTGEKLFTYVLIDRCNPPREIMLQFNDGAWSTRAYWGENLIGYGVDGTRSRLRMGDLPKGGEWVRLEFPASALGLEGRTLNGVAFVMYDGQAWFDRFGKAPAQSGASTVSPFSEGEGVPPVSLSIEARFIGEPNSTLTMRRHALYSPELQLMAETNTSALTPWMTSEYVWFNGEPVAQVNVPSGEIAYYFNDHLGAPLLQTDATGTVVWRVERDPYGERYVTRVGGARHQPLGLPGQEYDESAPDRQYSIFRWYRAGWGRYTQADPIGLEGGLNLYRYADANPISFTDPYGLKVCRCSRRLDFRIGPVMVVIPNLGPLKHEFLEIIPEVAPCGSMAGPAWGYQGEEGRKGYVRPERTPEVWPMLRCSAVPCINEGKLARTISSQLGSTADYSWCNAAWVEGKWNRDNCQGWIDRVLAEARQEPCCGGDR